MIAGQLFGQSLAGLGDVLGYAMLGVGPDHLVVAWNAAAERLWGYGAAEMVGQPVGVLVDAETRQRLEDMLVGATADCPQHQQLVGVRRDGSCVELDTTAGAVRDANGALTGLLIGAREAASHVVQRTRAQAALEHLSRQHALILEAAGDGMLGLDRNGRITFVNPAGSRLTGHDSAALIGRSAHTVLHAARIEPPYMTPGAATDGCWITARPASVAPPLEPDEDVFVRQDGSSFPVEVTRTALRQGDEHLGYVLVFRDITERRAAERLKRQFVSMVSHELRTPLHGIIGMTRLLLDTPLSKRQLTYAQGVRDGSDALLEIVNDLLDLSKIEAGKMALEDLDVNVVEMVEDVSRLLDQQARVKGLHVATSVQGDMPRRLVGDRNRLRQVLTNLVANAIKFTARGGVRVTVRRESTEGTDVVLRFEVADTGVGIAPDKQALLFEPYAQLGGGEEAGRGTGLGLAISQQLVSLMGGAIGVESALGQGALFWFTVRMRRRRGRPVRTRTQPLASMRSTRPWRVLVVEDVALNQQLAVGMLEALGCVAQVAATGQAALAALAALDALDGRAFDLVLMDVQMVGMDGLQTAIEIRRREQPAHHLPIVAMTARAMQEDRERCLAAGMDDYVSKPIRLEVLAATLTRWLSVPLPRRAGQRTASTSARSTDADVIDASVLQRLIDLTRQSDACFVDRLVTLFAQDTPPRLANLRLAVDQGDRTQVSAIAHDLSGSAGALGLRQMADLCMRLESLAVEPSGPALRQHLEAAERAFARARRALRQVVS
jgi:PAS domain S-box-containing protein